MLNDLDRSYHFEINNAHPLSYALKGSSLPSLNFRSMVDYLIQECESKGLPILVISTDGQWGRYGIRDHCDKPLTLYQLQRDAWNTAKRTDKSALKNGSNSAIPGQKNVKFIEQPIQVSMLRMLTNICLGSMQ